MFFLDLGQNGIATLALNQGKNRLLVMGPNYVIAFPVINLGSSLNMACALTNRPSADDLASAIAPRATGIAFHAFLLAPQLLIQTATSSLIGIDMAVDIVFSWLIPDLIGNLDGALLL